MSAGVVDVVALYETIDAKRQVDKLSWRALAGNLSIAPSTFSRMSQGKRPDVDTFAALLQWLEMPVEAFMEVPKSTTSEKDSVAAIGTYLRMDKNLTKEAAAALEELVKIAYERLKNNPAPE